MQEKFSENLVQLISQRIDSLRCEYGYSIRELAKISEVAPSTIYNLIQQNEIPNILTLQAICEALKITLSSLLAENEQSHTRNAKEALLLKIFREISPMSQDTLIKVSKCMK